MNIVLLGHDDLASQFALNRLAHGLIAHRLTAFVSGDLAATDAAHPALAELATIDRKLMRQYCSRGEFAAALADARPLPGPNSPQGLDTLRAADPDLVVSVRYRRILKDDAIAIPRHGVLNLHSGILPDYRGVMATFWAMLAGEPEIGSTLHWIVDGGIDTGPVIEIRRRPTEFRSSYLANVLALYGDGCEGLLDAIQAVAAGEVVPAMVQEPGSGDYFSSPDRAAVERFLAAGGRFADGSELKSLPE